MLARPNILVINIAQQCHKTKDNIKRLIWVTMYVCGTFHLKHNKKHYQNVIKRPSLCVRSLVWKTMFMLCTMQLASILTAFFPKINGLCKQNKCWPMSTADVCQGYWSGVLSILYCLAVSQCLGREEAKVTAFQTTAGCYILFIPVYCTGWLMTADYWRLMTADRLTAVFQAVLLIVISVCWLLCWLDYFVSGVLTTLGTFCSI